MRCPSFPILYPILAMRAQRPTQLFGLVQNMDMTTLLQHGLRGPREQRSIMSGLPEGYILFERKPRYKEPFLLNPEPKKERCQEPFPLKAATPRTVRRWRRPTRPTRTSHLDTRSAEA